MSNTELIGSRPGFQAAGVLDPVTAMADTLGSLNPEHSFDEREQAMSSRPSVLITGVPSGTGAVYADCFVRRGSDAVPTLSGCTVAQAPDDAPSKPVLSRALGLMRRAIDGGRAALRGLDTASPSPSSLEQAFSILLSEITTGRGLRLRIFVQGKPRALNPAIQEQLFLIGREAIMNGLRHSAASQIEVEVQYLPELLRVFVRDNGCGINPEAIQNESDSQGGLRGMRDRAENIGARFGIWSRPGLGTEVRVAIPADLAKRTTRDCGSGGTE